MLPAAVLLVVHALHFNFISDDAFISFRYARNLAEHGQLVFNLGERVEGFTNFLWTILLAAGLRLGVAPELSSRFLGVAFAVGTFGVLVRQSLRLDAERPRLCHMVAPLLLAGSSAYACWSTGGLETQLFTFLVTLAADRFLAESATGRGVGSAAAYAGAAMTRPEGALLFAVAAGVRVLGGLSGARRRWLPRARDWGWMGVFLLLFAPYYLWRWKYYGWPFPNTFYVKSSGGAGTAALGAYYLRRLAEDHALWVVPPLVIAGWPSRGDVRRRWLFALALLTSVVFLAYLVRVGGDFMGLYRFVLPLFPLLALLVQESLRGVGRRLAPLVPQPVLALAALTLGVGYGWGARALSQRSMSFVGADRGIDSPGYLKEYAEQRIPIGRWFARFANPDDLMTVGGAGVIPYYAGIAAYDVFGLVDERIAHDARMTVGNRPGHEKWGSDDYMVSRRPTLITHVYRLHERHQEPDPYWNARGYEWVAAEIPGLAAPPYYSFLKRMDRAFGPFPAHP